MLLRSREATPYPVTRQHDLVPALLMTSDLHNYIARARPQKTGKSAVMTSIWKRPLDIIVVFIFVQLFIVAITVGRKMSGGCRPQSLGYLISVPRKSGT